MTDQELLTFFREEGSKTRAFNEMVKKYHQKVYWMVRKMVIDHDDSNDVTQEVFIKAWNGIDSFRGESQLYTWLYRIASNEAINFLNKKKRRLQVSLEDMERELEDKLESDPLIGGDEIQLKLQKALLKLPEKQKLVFNLKYFEELPYEAISEITGTSVGALKASYHWAVKKIEDYLNGSD
ncbi:MAG: RNA polymerase subunit sigma [Cytophagaceae bacterium SCN 52-12]|nr:MAG: RNA polymerase subunit sigma [Cytophagaceae bacterium SCN 52-12]